MRDLNTDFTLKGCLFRSVKLSLNPDPDKYRHSPYGIRVDTSSSVHIDNKKKDILILGFGATQGLHNTTLIAEAQYSINFLRSQRKFCLSLHYNGSNNFLFVNARKIYQFKAKDFEIKKYPLCLGNISRDFTANKMKKSRIKWICLRIFC